MKRLIILSAIAMSGLIYNTADAQIGIHLGFHFGPRRVVYAPAPVVVEQAPVYYQAEPVYDDSNDNYYYLPDVDAYYSVNEQCYYYNDGGSWISAACLPGAYRDYDWRNAPRYEVRAPRPYLRNDFYRSRYNGHGVSEWAHNNNHFNGRYANRGFDQHFNNRVQGGFDQSAQLNRGFDRNNQHFDNRRQGGFNQSEQSNRVQGENNQHFDNKRQGGQTEPLNQNNGNARNFRGGNEHFAQNNRGGAENHRMSRF
jgi:hypothetical protein